MAKCTITVYIDYACLERIEAAAEEREVSRGELIREALEKAFPTMTVVPPLPSPPRS
jgi:hypothetical protein